MFIECAQQEGEITSLKVSSGEDTTACLASSAEENIAPLCADKSDTDRVMNV